MTDNGVKVEVVNIPTAPLKWKSYIEQLEMLNDRQALKITGLTMKEITALRQAAYRILRARAKITTDNLKLVLYLYKGGQQWLTRKEH